MGETIKSSEARLMELAAAAQGKRRAADALAAQPEDLELGR
jgi:hypothetical protein